MCYTGGPRCDTGAANALKKAKDNFAADPSDKNRAAVETAQREFMTSPAGIRKLREEGREEEANKYDRIRKVMIAHSQEREQADNLTNPNADPNMLHRAAIHGHYHAKVAVANNQNASVRTLQHIVDNEEEDDFRLAIARHTKATPEMVAWAAEHPAMHVKRAAMKNPNISQETLKKIASESKEKYEESKEKASYPNPEQSHYQYQMNQARATCKEAREWQQNPRREVSPEHYEVADNAIPRDGQYEKYYADTDAKHFSDKDKPGSKFTDKRVKNLNDVTALAAKQRGNLDGDDREELVRYGANPDAMNPNFRYLMVRTPGKVGAQDINSFPANTKFRVERTKAGSSASLVADVKEQPKTNFGVVIMGRPPGVNQDSVITAHPGLPSRSSGKDTFGEYEGRTLSMNHIMEIAGTNKVNINTRLV